MKKHTILMTICCLAPIAIAVILYYLFNLKTYALFVIILLCPVLHYFLMKDMHKKHGKYEEIKVKLKRRIKNATDRKNI